ncbi:hypothetical protein JTE90_024152 [Oedothorax gibbosus]|uniref:Uncharacterized protein n=1 Tax=Oedothorax gibbosus TaxID=931172 RepID=A0AAV6U493_9ARAC|nr:hypothetical protein JTE90_024152 [Oedothorax gibbosus]
MNNFFFQINLSILLLLIPCAFSQNVRSYDWRTRGGALSGWPDPSSLRPYSGPEPSSLHYPEDVVASYGDDSASYSQEYQPPFAAEPPQSLSSYESYHDSREQDFNMTIAKFGGFGGTGDTKGFGAYDFPHHANPPQEIEPFDHPELPQPAVHQTRPLHDVDPEIEDLMRISKQRSRGFHLSRDPILMHPL